MKWIFRWIKKSQPEIEIEKVRSKIVEHGGIHFVSPTDSLSLENTCGFVIAYFNPDYIKQQPWGVEVDYDCYAVETGTPMATAIIESMAKVTASAEKDGSLTKIPVYSLIRYVPILSTTAGSDSSDSLYLATSPGYIQESKIMSWPDDKLDALYDELEKILGSSDGAIVVRRSEAPFIYESLSRKVMFNFKFLAVRDYEKQELTYRLQKCLVHDNPDTE